MEVAVSSQVGREGLTDEGGATEWVHMRRGCLVHWRNSREAGAQAKKGGAGGSAGAGGAGGAGLLMGRGLIGDFKGFGCFPAGERILEQRRDVMATGSLWPWLSDQTKGGAHLGSTLQ